MLSPTLADTVTASQAARLAGVSDQTIRQWAAAGRISVQVTPLGRLFRAEEVERVARERQRRREARS